MVRKILLIYGILASLLYVAMNILVPMVWEGYRSASQTVSELSAIGAPTRQFWLWLAIPYSMLMAAFGGGVWLSAGRNLRMRVVGVLITTNAVIGLFWPPMHLRGSEFTLTDGLHIAFSMVTVLIFVLEIGFGAAAFGNQFRLYSIATLIVMIEFGILTGLDGPRIAANLPTPWVGVWERISIGAYMLWVVILAIALLRHQVTERKPHLVAVAVA